MSQYLTRHPVVIEAIANADINVGTVVIASGNNTGIKTPIVANTTADTDAWIGIAMGVVGDTVVISSGSLFNVALRQAGLDIKAKVSNGVYAYAPLIASGSSATFWAGSRTATATATTTTNAAQSASANMASGSTTVTMANVTPRMDAIALQQGSAGDIIDVQLVG